MDILALRHKNSFAPPLNSHLLREKKGRKTFFVAMCKTPTMGFIKIHRNIREWGWYDDANTLVVWIHLLIDANYEERTWHGETVGIGSLITSVARLSEQTGLSVKQVRTCLGRLVEDNKIVTQGASKWTDAGQTKGEQKASKGQTDGEQRATLKEYKEEYNTSDTNVSSYSIQENKKEIREAAERLYAIYPSKCPVSRRATGKSSKDKERLERLLKTYSEEELAYKIKRYVKECTEQESYIKNFSTFLNNLPDYSDNATETETKKAQTQKQNPGFTLSSGGLLDQLSY